MSLHDVSKHDDQRLDPKANASDTRAQRDATNTTSIHPVTDATTTKGFLKTGSGQILGNDGSNNIGLFGFDSTGTMVVKVAKTGFDADTASSDNLVFNSRQNVFKIINKALITIPAVSVSPSAGSYGSNVGTPTAFNHGLATVPAVLAFITDGAGDYIPFGGGYNTSLISNSSSAFAIGFQWLSITSTQIIGHSQILSLGSSASLSSQTVTCYILQETAS